jgi:hypothetical protein
VTSAKAAHPRTYLKAILAGVGAGAAALASGGQWWAGIAAAVGGFNLVYWPSNTDPKQG